jgi:ubiquinone/menaquinone biosynthesis C-methylase UbiE
MASQIDKDAFRSFERTAHDRIAASYNDLFTRITERAIARLLDVAQVRTGMRVLDVAAGPGRLTSAAAGRGALAVGCDLSPAMTDLARSLNPSIRFDEASADALPYPTASFEALVCSFGIGHFPDPERVMAEFARVVAPGGFAALSWWESFSRNRLNGIFYEVIAKLGVSAPSLPQGPPMDRFSNAQTFAELVQATGFTDVRVVSVASTYRLSNVDQLWELAMGSFARASSLILAQDQDIQRAIRTAVGEAAQQYAHADGLDIPIAFLIVSGKRSFEPCDPVQRANLQPDTI